MSSPTLPLVLTITLVILSSTSATEFIFNTNFNSTNLQLFGNATIQSSILAVTDETSFSIGRALYPSKIQTTSTNSSTLLPFSTSFIFSMAHVKNFLPGHGFVFIFTPSTGINGTSSSQHLGLFNLSNDGNPNNHVFGIEFDVFKNQEFSDINDNHVGVDVNSLTSSTSYEAGFWNEDEKFEELKLNNGENYQVWIDYLDSRINVTMAMAGMERPRKPLISEFVNLSSVLLDDMFVGFCAATGQLVESHKVLSWSFSNSNFSIGDALVTMNLPSFVPPKRRKRRKVEEREGLEDWELEYWPHRIGYQEIYAATKGFSDENVIGFGGNGKVYKGTLQGVEVAVKRIPHESEHGMREFLAEVSSLGRLKHRNLVGLRGWCKNEKCTMILVYDYMGNGSLEKRIFECDESLMLSWEERMKVLKDVAFGILYLHEGWEAKVLHRDIKASNVLLDKDMNARLGDFGLARMHHHGQLANTTRVVGTVGYMAPEVVRTGRASTHTDVFGFGILVLEVVSGKRPIEEGKPDLVDWVWRLMERGELHCGLDERLRSNGGFSIEEVERVLHLGLLCAYPDPRVRPTMTQVVKVLEGEKNEGTESEGEGMEVNLLDRIETIAMWSNFSQNHGGRGHHPTFGEISWSRTQSGSDIQVGR
uniref:non-specific serine/threonine protein kinase n=1 Tax=Fagus sylvatica TaxID=28930 RepID=A0A2N9ERU0_FAGSY